MKFIVPLIGQDKTVEVNLTVDPDTVIVHGNRSDGLPMCIGQPPQCDDTGLQVRIIRGYDIGGNRYLCRADIGIG